MTYKNPQNYLITFFANSIEQKSKHQTVRRVTSTKGIEQVLDEVKEQNLTRHPNASGYCITNLTQTD